MKIKGAIFDMDGTLVDSLWVWNDLWEDFGKIYLGVERFRPSEEDDKAVRTMLLPDAMQYMHERYHLGNSGDELHERILAWLPEFYRTRVFLKPGVREYLDDCYAKGIKMCIASATDIQYVRIAVEALSLSKYFACVLSCSEIGVGKDRPDIYELALQRLGTPPEETWVFEDSYVALETSVKLGLPTVGVYDPYNFEQERLKNSATHYIAEGETLMKLLQSGVSNGYSEVHDGKL